MTEPLVYDAEGYDQFGYNRDGFNRDGYDAHGNFISDKDETEYYDDEGYDADGYDVNGYDQNGFDINGFDVDGFNADGVNVEGYNIDGEYVGFGDEETPAEAYPEGVYPSYDEEGGEAYAEGGVEETYPAEEPYQEQDEYAGAEYEGAGYEGAFPSADDEYPVAEPPEEQYATYTAPMKNPTVPVPVPGTATHASKPPDGPWVHVTLPKQLSRILYTNPVCFLCTIDRDVTSRSEAYRNVMSLSWLTPTNNKGRFLFSINRRRLSSNILDRNPEFALSVPVTGMEFLLRNASRVSGTLGSKFQEDHGDSGAAYQGVPSLEAVPLGFEPRADDLFAIKGTIAHLHCTAYSILKDPIIDSSHWLVMAEIQSAYVHPSYWDAQRSLFVAQPNVRPYLTFYGSGTFGLVMGAEQVAKMREVEEDEVEAEAE